MLRPCCPSRGASCSSRRAMSPRCGATPSPSSTRSGSPRLARRARERSARRRGRARPVSPLHAQGDPRAAPRHRADARGARIGPQALGCGVRTQRPGGVQAESRRVHIAACGTSYHAGLVAELFHRADIAASRRASRSRANIATAIRSSRRTRCSSPSPNRARPRTRWRRCATRKPGRVPLDALDLQRRRELHGARIGISCC